MNIRYCYFIFASLIMVSMLSGCTKQLDITPQGEVSKGNFWKTSADALKGANAMYANFDDEDFYGRGFMWYINASDDMITGRSNGNAENIRTFSANGISASYIQTQWSLRYKVIKGANDVLNNVPAIDMDATLKNRILGEAYFLSGLMYFQLSYNYGDDKAGVPLVTPANSNDSSPKAREANVTLNYNYVISQLKTAARLLPYFSGLAATDYGRPHKAAAWSYLSKTYLYMKDYANAELYADSVINFGNRSLEPNFADVFVSSHNWGTEYIWSAYSTPSGTSGWGSILPGVMLENKGWGAYNGWGYYTPTKELFDAYSATDKRRAATILAPGDTFTFFGATRTYASDNSLSGYQFNKYMEPFKYANPIGTYLSPNGDHPTTTLNPPLMRYAEILLIKAEAELMLGKNADKEINKIRERAGLADVSGATMTELKLQRRLEFAGEWADRHRDLVRWGDAQAAYALPLHGATGAVVSAGRTFNPAVHDVWPVPQQEIDNSGGVITQASGW